ncbi:MAG: hypothetical protein R2932_13090 [Caldilineaceae bacterium]
MLKLGVIGAGLIGQKHVELVAAHGACDLVALCDANPAAAAVALRYGSRFFKITEHCWERCRWMA